VKQNAIIANHKPVKPQLIHNYSHKLNLKKPKQLTINQAVYLDSWSNNYHGKFPRRPKRQKGGNLPWQQASLTKLDCANPDLLDGRKRRCYGEYWQQHGG